MASYRYETFLGSVANYILYHLIETQFSSKIEGLSVSFDEMGLECNEWIPFESILKIPHTVEQFQEWISSHLPLLKGGFSWNSWMHWLPEEHQQKRDRLSSLRPKSFKTLREVPYRNDVAAFANPSHGDDEKKIATQCTSL